MSKEKKALIIIPTVFVSYEGFKITEIHFGWLRKMYYWKSKNNNN